MNSPGDYIREELKRRGWGQADLAQIMERPVQRISELVIGKLGVSPEVAVGLASALGGTAEEWLQREAVYRLSLLNADTSAVRRRARLHEIAPIKELQKRSWIKSTESADELEKELLRFFRLSSLEEEPSIHGAMRKTAPGATPSLAQRAWAFRVRQIAEAIPSVPRYDAKEMPKLLADVRKLAAYSKETRKAPALLMSYGIRFVVVEGLPGAKMDGFATSLDDEYKMPVIGMSLRYDRLDSFWFTLAHELSHVKHGDLSPVDGDVSGQDDLLEVKPPMERRADEEAAETFIPKEELDSFILRARPFYSLDKINKFANRIKMHPNIIIGQLKHRGELKHSQHTKTTIPIRELVTSTAITEGWGKFITLGESS